MTFDAGYFERSLARRADGRKKEFDAAVGKLISYLASKGMLGSGTTLLQMTEIAVTQLTEDFKAAATLGFSLAEHNGPEVSEPLERFADHICSDMLAYLTERGKNTGLSMTTVTAQLQKLVGALDARKEHLLDDFRNGIMGNERMKKEDPVVSIIANQTGSPGGVQQIGVGRFSQNAFVENSKPLLAAIDEALASKEFAGLQPDQQDGFRDIAGAFKGELSKASPDQGALRRWGGRLVEFSKQVGLETASSTIAELLVKIFMGS
jgi:hypothetical protein